MFLKVETQARTAPAEGREAQTETPTGPVTSQDAAAAQAQQDAGTPAPGAEPVAKVPAAVETPLPVDPAIVLADETSTTAEGAPAPMAGPALEGAGTEQTGVEAPVSPGGSSPMPEVAEPVLEGTGAVAGPAVDPEAAATAAASASDPDVEPAPAQAPARPGQSAAPSAEPAAVGAEEAPAHAEEAPAHAEKPARPDQGRPAEQERPAGAPGRGVSLALGHERGAGHGGEPSGDGQPAAPSTPAAHHAQAGHAPAAASPAPVAQPAAMPQPAGALTHPLATQAHRVQALVELAVSRGAASAHLELYPAELGRVQLRMRSVAGGGLTASMTVDRPEALQALQQAADQLRRTLEERGVEVVRLEIGLSAQARGDEAKTGARSDGRDASGADARRGGTDAATDHDHDDVPSRMRPLNPGALIDVHA